MKPISTAATMAVPVLALVILVAPALGTAYSVPSNIIGGSCCAREYDPNVDYFPDKVILNHRPDFSVQYFNNYKVVRINRTDERYVLYQKGTPQPWTPFVGQPNVRFIAVPIERAAVLSNSYFAYFELLGERKSMRVTTSHEFLNDPCLIKMANEGEIADGVTNRDLINNNVFLSQAVDVIFRWHGDRDNNLNNAGPVSLPPVVRIETQLQTEPHDIMEWIEYVSLFFNREAVADRMTNEMKARYDCVVTAARRQPPVNVLYSTFSYDSATAQVRCSFSISTWARNMLLDIGANVLPAYPGFVSSAPCNMTAFRQLANTADVWLYDANNFIDGRYGATWAVLRNISSEIDTVAPYVNNRTFDPNGNHFRDYFASRMVELDVEMEDFLKILHPSIPYDHEPVWWLNVRTEEMPDRPSPDDCTCKYGPQQLKSDSCPLNPWLRPSRLLPETSEYGCNGELDPCAAQPHAIRCELAGLPTTPPPAPTTPSPTEAFSEPMSTMMVAGIALAVVGVASLLIAVILLAAQRMAGRRSGKGSIQLEGKGVRVPREGRTPLFTPRFPTAIGLRTHHQV